MYAEGKMTANAVRKFIIVNGLFEMTIIAIFILISALFVSCGSEKINHDEKIVFVSEQIVDLYQISASIAAVGLQTEPLFLSGL